MRSRELVMEAKACQEFIMYRPQIFEFIIIDSL